MDNLTHTLIGVAIGHLAASKERGDVRAQVMVAALASNAPDLDVLIEPVLGGGKLGYLLHHRGYTHTLLAMLPLSLLAALLGQRLGGEARPRLSALMPAALVGVGLHLVADGWNDYGVHPLSPFFDRWVYGDTIFIVEPLIIFALLPLAIRQAGGPIARGIWAALGALLLAAAFFLPQIRWPASAWVAGYAGAMWLISGRLPGPRLPVAVVLSALAVFAAGSTLSRAKIVATAAPGEQTLDVVITPAPADPLCHRALWVGISGGEYVVRKGAVSLLPSVIAPDRCSFGRSGQGTAPLSASTARGEAGVVWEGEFRAPTAELARLAAEECQVRDALRFMRAPYWVKREEGLLLGDLRYDNEPGLGFAELLIPASQLGTGLGCYRPVPPWEPPLARAGLLAR